MILKATINIDYKMDDEVINEALKEENITLENFKAKAKDLISDSLESLFEKENTVKKEVLVQIEEDKNQESLDV